MRELEKQLWRRVYRYLPLLRFVPGLRMVAVCNNLAFGSVHSGSDIDLFVVARKGQLFTVRIFVTFILQLLGVRRHGSKVAGRFCLSFFVDDSALNLEDLAIERDYYLAFWILTMRPVIDDGVYQEFLRENAWVGSYVKSGPRSGSYVKFEPWKWKFFSFFEDWMRNWQLKRAGAKRRRADERASLVVSEHVLKFHNIDRRKFYRDSLLSYFDAVTITDDQFFKFFRMNAQIRSALAELSGAYGLPSSSAILAAEDGAEWSGKMANGGEWQLVKNNDTSYNVHCGR